MARVSDILKTMSELRPDAHPARLALFNYLQNFIPQAESLGPLDLERFVRRCLHFSHWRENKAELLEQVGVLLTATAARMPLSMDWDSVVNACGAPEWELHRDHDVQSVLNRYLQGQSQTAQVRMLKVSNHRTMTIALMPDRSVQVRIFSHWFCLREGLIVPLLDDLVLNYGPNLELVPQWIHQIEVNPNTTCRFGVNQAGCTGVLIRGYTFQRYEILNGGPIESHPELVYPLRKLEGHFIQKRDDPVYQQITELLEKSSKLLADGKPGSLGFAMNALEQARHAHENLFASDRMLALVIRELSDKIDARMA